MGKSTPIIQSLYSNSWSLVCACDDLSFEFTTRRPVRQGSFLSPFIEMIMNLALSSPNGSVIDIHVAKKLSDLKYPEDSLLLKKTRISCRFFSIACNLVQVRLVCVSHFRSVKSLKLCFALVFVEWRDLGRFRYLGVLMLNEVPSCIQKALWAFLSLRHL